MHASVWAYRIEGLATGTETGKETEKEHDSHESKKKRLESLM
jgi:hypothetical protein